jgi:hypothetical protein
MKSRIFGIYILTLFTVSAFAQEIEHDDMYFNSKDRQKLRELSAQQYAVADARKSERRNTESEELNPTDSYSARTVNPEYSSRSNAETAQADNEDYFVNNYRYQTANNLNQFNNNFNNWYNSSWYQRNYWGPSIYSWNSPFYGSYYNPWGNPWNDPFYRANYSSSFSFHWGSRWNYGWGFDNYWGHPANAWGWGSGWGPSYAFGYNSWYGPSWYGGGYPRVIVVNNNYGETGRKVVYGKRPVRSSTMASDQYNTRTRTSSYDQNTSGRPNSGGRTSSGSNEYYNKSWRYTSPANSNSTNTYNSNTRTRSSSYSNDSNSQRNSSFGNSNNSYSTPSRSSSPSYNSGSRSSSPSPSGGSSGRTRGSR